MKSISDTIKSIIIVALVLILGVAAASKLMEIQIVKSDSITNPLENSANSIVYTKNTKATRGQILDYNGNVIIGNKTCTDIVLRKALFPEDYAEGNDILIQAYNILKECGYEYEDSLPITLTSPYVFTDDDTDDVMTNLNINLYATADDCIYNLISDYEISDSYTEEEQRIIAGMRYDMLVNEFSYNTDFVLASDVDTDTIVTMKEMSNFLSGIDAVESSEREIVQDNVLPHEVGTVGPIYKEEYEELKEEGYALDDTLGKTGIESAMETELRGVNGEEEITVSNNAIADVDTISEAQPGYDVRLTVDSNYQKKLQSILENFLANFHNINQKTELADADVSSGAIVVLDAKTGAIRGMATAPTYTLTEYMNNYDEILNAENSPLLDRATYGLYRPGSTFKTITATAGLNEGIVNGGTYFTCTQKYDYKGTEFSCTGYHGGIAITRAIEVSCNIYFYELSQRLGIDNITKYAELYGLGQHTGIETGDAAGYLANPETYASKGLEWYVGYVLQAGIGNMDCGMTPLQMAVVASTIANDGVRYKPYLVEGLYNYGTDNAVSVTEPTVAAQIELNYDYVYDYIEQGMIAASLNVPSAYSLANLGFDVAIKTGTPQISSNLNEQNSFFIGYAPADDPEIAFAGVIENGEYSKYMIRDIILAYQECYGLNGVGPTASSEITTETTTSAVTGTGTSTTTTTVTTTVSE
jgi:penicillin-binding protein 2